MPSEIRLEPSGTGDRVQFSECRPVVVRATGQINGQDITWTRQIAEGRKKTSDTEAQEALAIVKDVYRRDALGERTACPVLAYYGAGRAWLPSNERVSDKIKTNGPARRWAAFYDCFNERIRFPDLRHWFRRELMAAGNRGGRMRPGFEVVRQAVLRCVDGADNVSYNPDRETIVLSVERNPQPLHNLSAGQGMMLAMAADIAIRAVTQNAHLLPPDTLGPDDEPVPRVLRETPGVVLIDELDAHLHPRWQRRVANDLKRTFPGIQFVCTSHSPQVIGEVAPEEIRLLDVCPAQTPNQSFGMDSNWILQVLMQAEAQDAGIRQRLEEVLRLITQRQIEAAESEVIALRQQIGNSEALQRAASTIERVRLLGR